MVLQKKRKFSSISSTVPTVSFPPRKRARLGCAEPDCHMKHGSHPGSKKAVKEPDVSRNGAPKRARQPRKFLDLPAELRNEIYNLTVSKGAPEIFFFMKDGRLSSMHHFSVEKCQEIVLRWFKSYDESESESESGSEQSTDPLIEMLAERAARDWYLTDSMLLIYDGEEGENNLKYFRRIVSELTEGLEGRPSTLNLNVCLLNKQVSREAGSLLYKPALRFENMSTLRRFMNQLRPETKTWIQHITVECWDGECEETEEALTSLIGTTGLKRFRFDCRTVKTMA